MGSSWVALAVGEDPQLKRERNSTRRNGSRRRKWTEGEGRGGGEAEGREGSGGTGVLNRETNRRMHWKPSLIVRMS